jgi:hypothetical protein
MRAEGTVKFHQREKRSSESNTVVEVDREKEWGDGRVR